MNVLDPAAKRTRVRLPADVIRPFEVYVNGVPQTEGFDFDVEGRTLLFTRELKSEGKLGFWRWTSMFLGIAGTYRRDDKVDVIYDSPGGRLVETGLRFERG